jgi:hypothetical protein
MPTPAHRHERVLTKLLQEDSQQSRQHIGRPECAVNVPYGHNPPSISSYFCNLSNTFRASVFCG